MVRPVIIVHQLENIAGVYITQAGDQQNMLGELPNSVQFHQHFSFAGIRLTLLSVLSTNPGEVFFFFDSLWQEFTIGNIVKVEKKGFSST